MQSKGDAGMVCACATLDSQRKVNDATQHGTEQMGVLKFRVGIEDES